MSAASRIEISASAYRRNLAFLRSVLGQDAILSSVVKGNAYGHGLSCLVPLAERHGVSHFSVFSAGEAAEVHAVARPETDILVLGFLDEGEVEWAVEKGISFVVFDPGRLEQARRAAARVGRPARIHLELETGMNRTGLAGEELPAVAETFRREGELLLLEGACTHYAGAESEGNYLRVQRQVEVFRERIECLRGHGLEPRIRHTAGSAAALVYPETIMDLARIGILQYGFWPSLETRMRFLLERERDGGRGTRDPLRRVMRWVTSVMSVKDVVPGEFVGYGRSYLTTRRQRIATIPVGYAQGFPRVLSNLGYVLVGGRRAPVVGVVNMHSTTVDVTGIPNVSIGDEVVIIGRQGRAEISVGWFGDMTRTLNYEVLVRIPRDIPREVVA